jgi:transposase
MTEITTIGLDLAKTVFQVHGADDGGNPVLRKKLRRGQVLGFFAGLSPCRVGMEACASAHYWARELQALGHEVRLIPPQYVKPFVKTNKNDATDAEAICEALSRPTMRFASVKSADQQSVLMLHRSRELLVRQRTMLINALRGHCGEFGLVAAQDAVGYYDLSGSRQVDHYDCEFPIADVAGHVPNSGGVLHQPDAPGTKHSDISIAGFDF